MKKNLKLVIVLVLVLVLGGGGGAAWWLLRPKPALGPDGHPVAEEKKPEKKEHNKYLTLDKVVVMLRRAPGDSASHYLSTDLVITTTAEKEKMVKDHLPLLRSIAVKALASTPMEKAETMSVEQFAELINKAFEDSYTKQKIDKPFSEVMIGKLIIE